MNDRKFEYIDREKAIKELTDWTWGLDATCVMQAIGHVPAEDVAPVVHAKWFLLNECSNEGVYCSNCHKKVYRSDYANQKVKSKYCPNCGARMGGDSDV